MLGLRNKLERAAQFFHLESWFRLLLLCVLVGVIAGTGAVIFDQALKFAEAFLLNGWLFKTDVPEYRYWTLILVPAAGGALAGALTLWLAPEARGHGTDAVIRAFHQNKGHIRARVPLVKGVCSILTIGTGGSAGKEGPIAQIGAGFGSSLATLLKLSPRDRRILMLAGVAGGIGAIFKAPLGGALFAAEVLYRDPDFEHDAVIPGIISSVTAYSVLTAILGYDRILQFADPVTGQPLAPLTFPSVPGASFSELFHYASLSLLCAMVAFLFVKGMQVMERRCFHPLALPRIVKPALGGALLGALALLLLLTIGRLPAPHNQVLGASHPEHIMAGGYQYLQQVLSSALDTLETDPFVSLKLAGFLSVVVIGKIIGTGLTIGSGGSGGVLFPALFLGGITGAAYSKLWRALSDSGLAPHSLAMTPGARAGMILVGMGGLFAACMKTPIASLVMVSEITGSYGLVVPLMLTCTSAYILSHAFTMNEEQVRGIADSPAHRGDFQIDVLAEMKVRDAIAPDAKLEAFQADTPFCKILARIKDTTATAFPVVDETGHLVGIFSLSDIRRILSEPHLGSLVVAGDLGSADAVTVTMTTSLDEALREFIQKNVDEMPVVEEEPLAVRPRKFISLVRRPRGPVGSKRVIGMLARRDLIAAYHRKLSSLQILDAQEHKGSRVFDEALAAAPEAETQIKLPARSLRHAPVADASNATKDMLIEPPDDSLKA